MDMVSAIVGFIVLGAAVIFLAFRGDRHDREIKELRKQQTNARSGISNLNYELQTLQNRRDNAEVYATRLLEEQIAMKLDAMDACKAMLREIRR